MKQILEKKTTLIFSVLLVFLVVATASSLGGRSIRKGYLGVSVERLSREERQEMNLSHGVQVTHVTEKSPADKAGLLEDDVILYFNGKKIRRPEHLVDAVREVKPKTAVKVTLMRDSRRMDLDVTVGKYRSRYISSWGDDADHVTILAGGGAYLGVELHTLNQDLASYFGVQEDGGALILEVEEDSPAADAGMKGGDIIVSIDGDEVMDPYDVRDILSDFEEGDEVEIGIMRQKQKQNLTVELEQHPRHSSVRILKGLRDRDYDRLRRLHIEGLHDLDISIPEFDFDFDHDFEFDCEHDHDFEFDNEHDIHIDGLIKSRVREKLERIEENMRDKARQVESRLHRIKVTYSI